MSIKKRPGSPYWWVFITAPSGERIRRSTGTTDRTAALEFRDRLKSDLWRVSKLNEKAKHTFEEAAVLAIKDAEGQANYNAKLKHIEYWRSVFSGRAICSLTSSEIISALPTHQAYTNRPAKKLANATQNRYLSTMRRVMNLAKQAHWIDVVPHLSRKRERKVNIRWITQTEADKLLRALSLDWMKDVCQFALLSGARANEILSLTWDKVDLDRSNAWVTNDLAKSGKARSMPLNPQAVALLKERKKLGMEFCFTRDTGKRVWQIDKRMLDRAAEQINIPPLKFHDLRHTWASWHVQSGTPLMVLKELGGWETIEMVQKYAHLSAGHLAQYANVSQFLAQNWHNDESGNKKAA